MAHQPEPMDIDNDFDNKENSFHHNNVLPFTEKGYEELDVSELNMKLRYSVTPASSPMSKSYTAAGTGNRNFEAGDETLNVTVNENLNLTRSLNSTVTVNDNSVKALKALPLQSIPPEQLVDNNRNNNILRPLETDVPLNNGNLTVTINAPTDIDENMSLPSSSSSAIHTPEATTPTNDMTLKNGGSPIMRGLKTVLNMFRSSQSPIPPADSDIKVKPELLSPEDQDSSSIDRVQNVLASTPISSHHKKEMSPTKRNSPQKDSTIVFNDDLEKELQWKDETTIIFSQERIPIHKLLLQNPKDINIRNKEIENQPKDNTQDLNTTVEYMDISYNDSFRDRTITNITENVVQIDKDNIDNSVVGESDSEFVDCETTFTKNESFTEDCDKTPVAEDSVKDVLKNESGSRLKQIILDTTQDILDATLSVRPEDLMSETFDQAKIMSTIDEKSIIDTEKQVAETTVINEVKLNASHTHIKETDDSANSLVLKQSINNSDVTKTIDVMSNTQPENQTIEISSTETDKDNEKPHSNMTLTIENVVSVNEITNDKQTIIQNLKITNNMTELPIDVPLPDEDDLDNEITIPLDTTITDTSIAPENNSIIMSESYQKIPENNEKLNLTETLNDTNNTVCNEAVPICKSPVYNTEMSDNLDKSKINTTRDIVEDTVTESNQVIHTNDEVSPIETAETTEAIYDNTQESNNLTITVNEKQEIIPMDINESINEFKPMPDIINETVTALMQDKDESFGTAVVQEQVELEPIGTNVATNENVILLTTIIDEQTGDVEKLPIIESHNSITEELPNLCSVDEKGEFLEKDLDLIDPVELLNNEILPVVEDYPEQLESQVTEIACTEQNEEMVEEQIVVSGNNSPFVSVTSENLSEDLKGTEIDVPTCNSPMNIEVVSMPPQSPPIASKGYNFNFDDMSFDPFATKTKIRMSPPLDSPAKINTDEEPNKNFNRPVPKKDLNRRKSQPEKKRPSASKKKFNSTFSGKFNENIDEKPFGDKIALTIPTPIALSENKLEENICDKFIEKLENNQVLLSQPGPIVLSEDNVIENISEKPLENLETNVQLPTPPNENANNINESTSEKPENDEVCQLAATTPSDKNNLDIQEMKDINAEVFSPVTEILSDDVLTAEPDDILKKQIEQSVIDTLAKVQKTDSNDEFCVQNVKESSSSEQSTYLSACGSSTDSNIPLRNVFNLPEIDDIHFNPFASKSKIRQSPVQSLEIENPFMTKPKLDSSPNSTYNFKDEEEKVETEYMEKDASGNLSNSTNSSKATDEKNITAKEVNTEDEDTIEGPFIVTEDIESFEKKTNLDDKYERTHFDDLPSKSNEENLDGEMFIDAEAFEFLLNQNKCNTVVDSGKESLFLKFDPLFAKRMSAITSDGVVAALSKIQNIQSTPIKATKALPKSISPPVAGPSNLNVTQDIDMNTSDDCNDDLNLTISKPMMVVPPAVNSVTPRNKSITPNRSSRSSVTFTSPAMAVIDRLLSLSANNSLVHETTITQVNRDPNDTEIALSQLRELLAEKEINVYKLRSESNDLKDRLSSLENHVKNLETEAESRLQKINQLNCTLVEKTKINKSMAVVVEEYERTIARLIADTAQDKKKHDEERIKLINERDEQTAHLASMEVSFSDLHSKYEKSKQVILSCKANENIYKESIKQFEESLAKMQSSYEHLKQHASSKLNNANLELEKINKSHEAEVLKLNAMIKRKELHITSLEESLTQKTKANEELTAICDELINKVG